MVAGTLIRRSLAVLLLGILVVSPVWAQTAGEAAPDAVTENDEELQEQGEEGTAAPEDGFRFDFYGRLKADASSDTSLIDPGNFARWVESPDLAADHSHFNLTVRESRLGTHILAPGDGPAISGHVEIDFYGGGAENRNVVMLRHAHIDVDWDSGWSLLAGQYSDVISPLVPRTVNYSVAWWVGNIGYRRPQFRMTKTFGDDAGLVITGAVSRTIGDDFAQEPGDSGVDSGRPTVQGRVAWEWGRDGRRGGLGISGHQGTEDLSDDFQQDGLDYDSWSVGADLQLPLGRRWLIKGEAWTGENLDDYLGGIGQGVNVEKMAAVRSTGGWGSVEYQASDELLLSAGFGVDDPRDDDLALKDVRVRTYNRVVWVNGFLDLGRGLSTGLEVSHWRTDHGELATGDALRFQVALIFAF